MTEGARYIAYDKVFGVERAESTGAWFAVGHQRGHRPYRLDKLGSRPDREAMQKALDVWAARQGLRPMAEKAKSAHAEMSLPI